MQKLSICVPTYNEAYNIKGLLDGVELAAKSLDNYQINVIIIDDNSPDHTAEIAQNYAKSLTKVSVDIISNPSKLGLANAYKKGFEYCLSTETDYILQMDADLSHNPIYIPDFLEKVQRVDFVIGTRYIKGGGTKDWDFKRKLISKLGNFYTNLVLGTGLHDVTGGFNMYKSDTLRQIDLKEIKSNGFAFQIEVKYKLIKLGMHYAETAIVFAERLKGKSKINQKIIKEGLVIPWKLRFM